MSCHARSCLFALCPLVAGRRNTRGLWHFSSVLDVVSVFSCRRIRAPGRASPRSSKPHVVVHVLIRILGSLTLGSLALGSLALGSSMAPCSSIQGLVELGTCQPSPATSPNYLPTKHTRPRVTLLLTAQIPQATAPQTPLPFPSLSFPPGKQPQTAGPGACGMGATQPTEAAGSSSPPRVPFIARGFVPSPIAPASASFPSLPFPPCQSPTTGPREQDSLISRVSVVKGEGGTSTKEPPVRFIARKSRGQHVPKKKKKNTKTKSWPLDRRAKKKGRPTF